jgi:hypothetical protein
MRREEKLDKEQKEYLDRLCASDAALAAAHRLVHEFTGMVRGLEGEKLDEALRGLLFGGGGNEEVCRRTREGASSGKGWADRELEYRTRLRLHPQSDAHKAPGLRPRRLRFTQSKSPSCINTARKQRKAGSNLFTKKPTEPSSFTSACSLRNAECLFGDRVMSPAAVADVTVGRASASLSGSPGGEPRWLRRFARESGSAPMQRLS